jgi:hypothetical protein
LLLSLGQRGKQVLAEGVYPRNEQDRSDVETELETHPDEYDLAIPWYWHEFEPENYPDPTTTEEQDHRCDLSEPTYQNPGGVGGTFAQSTGGTPRTRQRLAQHWRRP